MMLGDMSEWKEKIEGGGGGVHHGRYHDVLFELSLWDHSISTYVEFSEKLTFLLLDIEIKIVSFSENFYIEINSTY